MSGVLALALKRLALSNGTLPSAVPVGHPTNDGTSGTLWDDGFAPRIVRRGLGPRDVSAGYNNTLFDNDTQHTGTGEFQIQWHATGDTFENNITYANAQCLLVSMTPHSVQPTPATPNNNIYYCGQGPSQAQFVWQTATITGFSKWSPTSGQDGLSLFINPQFASTSARNFDVLPTSPAIGEGTDLSSAILGVVDFAGNPRIGANG